MAIAVFLNAAGEEVDTHLFNQSEITLGLAAESTLCLSGANISPTHCRLSISGSVLILQREGAAQVSVNGTPLDGPRELTPSDVIMVGENLIAALMYDPESEVPPVPTQLAERIVERDLVLRMGGARPPSTLNSVYNALQEEEATQVQKAPSSLNSIYHAYLDGESTETGTAEEPISYEPTTQVDPSPPKRITEGPSDTPTPSKPRTVDPHEPSSLESIYNALTPIPEELRVARTQFKDKSEIDEVSKSEPKRITEVSGSTEGDPLKTVLTPPLLRLVEGAAIEEIHCAGAHKLSCRVKGSIRPLSHEQPFDNIEHALEVHAQISDLLCPLEDGSASGRIGGFWVSALNVLGEPHLCFERLSPIGNESVIAAELMPQLGKFMARGARFLIASPRGERRAAESVAAAILKRYGQAQRYGLIGVQRSLGEDPAWFELGQGDRALRQAASLCLDGVVIGDHPSLSGDLLFDLVSDIPSSMVLVNARNAEAAFHKARWRSAHKHLAAATISMVIFAKEIDGKPKLSSIHSYATGEKVYQLPRG